MTTLVDTLIEPNGSNAIQKNCFVCDVSVIGKYYSLASCRTNNTKIRLIEKLGQMVGDKYMVVISEEDVICTGCANLINTLDRIENEVISVRGVILRFLEKKYSLDEGELMSNKLIGFGHTPVNGIGKYSAKGRPNNESFMSRKRKAALTSNLDFENDQENSPDIANRNEKKANSDVWMQCDKCKYTTPYNAFLNNHINHIPKKPQFCDYCHDELKDGNCTKNCNQTKIESPQILSNENSFQLNEDKTNEITTIQSVPQEESVELITAEINDYNNRTISDTDNLLLSNLQENNPRSQNETFILPELPSNCNQPLLINPHHVGVESMNHNLLQQPDVKNICSSIQDTSQTSNHPLLSIPKLSEEDNNTVYVQVVDMGKPNTDTLSSMTKQVLTVSEDGSVEMVEVVWDELLMSGQGSLSY